MFYLSLFWRAPGVYQVHGVSMENDQPGDQRFPLSTTPRVQIQRLWSGPYWWRSKQALSSHQEDQWAYSSFDWCKLKTPLIWRVNNLVFFLKLFLTWAFFSIWENLFDMLGFGVEMTDWTTKSTLICVKFFYHASWLISIFIDNFSQDEYPE